MYSEKFTESIRKVEAAREKNIAYEPARMTAKEKEDLLAAYHPDYKKEEFEALRIGPNKGEKVPHELAEMLQAHSRIRPDEIDLAHPDYDVDVLVIGGGGAGSSAAIEADNAGAKVMIVTKLRIGDANTMMAEGGIQAADKPNDSPAIHFIDAFGGGHFAAKRELLYKLVTEAPEAIASIFSPSFSVPTPAARTNLIKSIPYFPAQCKAGASRWILRSPAENVQAPARNMTVLLIGFAWN